MLRQRSTMVPQARQQLQHSSAMYEVISTCLQGRFTCSVSSTHRTGDNHVKCPSGQDALALALSGACHCGLPAWRGQPETLAVSLRTLRPALQEDSSGTPPPAGWKGGLSRAMSRKPSMVRGPELKARMTYTAGLSNIREASAPLSPGERKTPAAPPCKPD